jgi:hypothetical protein
MRFTATAALGQTGNSKLIELLLVGGGGGGGAITGSKTARTFLESGAGGGAGGYVSQSFYIYDSSSFTLTIGNGGVGGCLDTTGAPCGYSANGENSVLLLSSSVFDAGQTKTITAYGGGFGGSFNTIQVAQVDGGTGGSGGGNNGLAPYGQGFQGGVVDGTTAAGGGGASIPGGRQALGYVSGGDGKLWLDGNYYAGGGGAGTEILPPLPNSGGLGGGGRGGITGSSAGTYLPNGVAGTANTGGGGGGKGRQQDSTGAGTFTGGTGGSGVCKIRYLGSGSIFNAGSASYNSLDEYTYVTFTGSISFKNF